MYINEKHKDFIERISLSNEPQWNRDKATEECVEFLEAIVKRQTKKEGSDKKPPVEELIKEFSDVHFRGIIFILQNFPGITLDTINALIAAHVYDKVDWLMTDKFEVEPNGKRI